MSPSRCGVSWRYGFGDGYDQQNNRGPANSVDSGGLHCGATFDWTWPLLLFNKQARLEAT